MKKIYTDTTYTIEQLISQIETGEIAVPDLQREYVWKPSDIRDLLDSMYKGYPIGYLLLWQAQSRKDDNRLIGTEQRKNNSQNYLIIDGQQRLTSLYAIMTGKPIKTKGDRQVKIAFNPLEKKFDVQNASIKKNPEWIANISDIYLSTSPRRFINTFISNLNESRQNKQINKLTEEEENIIEETINEVLGLKKYTIGTLTINFDIEEETIADIFTRVNSGGCKLTENDFILTLISVNDPKLRDNIEKFCRENNNEANSIKLIELEPKHLVRVAMAFIFKRARLKYAYQVLRGIDLKRGTNKQESEEAKKDAFQNLRDGLENVLCKENWQGFIKAIMSSGYINKNMISSNNTLIGCYTIYLIGKYDFKVDNGMLRNLIARWFYMSSLKVLYTWSFETTLQEQLNELYDMERTPQNFKNYINKKIKLELTDDYFNQNLPENLITSSTNSPYWNSYLAALNILDEKVLFSDLHIRVLLSGKLDGNRKAVECHHLFPKAYLSEIGYSDDKDRNQIANYTYIEWPDNMEVSDENPATYFPQMVEKYIPSEQRSIIMEVHALPDNWHTMDYYKFLDERRKLMSKVIKKGYEKITNPEFE